MRKTSFSPNGLQRLHKAMAGYVDSGDRPGIVTVVATPSEVHIGAVGTHALGGLEKSEVSMAKRKFRRVSVETTEQVERLAHARGLTTDALIEQALLITRRLSASSCLM
jgi:hypothetical protein